MDSWTDSKRSSRAPEPLDLDVGLPTTAADIAVLRALRHRWVPDLLVRMNDLSATRLFPNLTQRRTTSAGFEPFRL
jgi:hypothetical protein